MKTSFMIAFFILAMAAVSSCNITDAKPQPTQNSLIVGTVVDTGIETPHPYSNADSGRKAVWAHTLTHPNATSLRVHFSKFDLKSGDINPPQEREKKDYGECDLNAPEGYKRELINPNTIQETAVTEEKQGVVSIGSMRQIKCGVIEEKKEYTAQEIYDNSWMKGDILIVKDGRGNVLEIITQSPFFLQNQSDFWSHTYPTNTLILELNVDEKDNAYGLSIDKYARGLTEEEKEQVNQQRYGEYYQDCGERGIPRNECQVPK